MEESSRGFDAVLLGGDISGRGDPLTQRDFFRDDFRGMMQRNRNDLPPFFIIPGNDDYRSIIEPLQKTEGVILPIEKPYPLFYGLQIIGYPYIPISPFHNKDFEKRDQPGQDKLFPTARLTGHAFRNGRLTDYTFDLNDDDTIKRDLEEMSDQVNEKTIFMTHCPPRELGKFRTRNGRTGDMGSPAIKNFILKNPLYFEMYGHNHEPEDNSPVKWLGKTPCAYAGTSKKPKELIYLEIEIRKDLSWKLERRCR